MILNIVNGRPKPATINVTTTAGATVTCVLAPYSLSATANSSGAASFVVPKIGSWVVTSTLGSISKSATVSVTGTGTFSTTLALAKYLYNNGTQTVAWKTGGGSGSFATDSMHIGDYSYFVITNAVDLTPFTSIVFKHKYSLSSGSRSITGGCWPSAPASYASPMDASGTITSTSTVQTTKVSISSITGNKYVGFRCGGTESTGYTYVYEVYLE